MIFDPKEADEAVRVQDDEEPDPAWIDEKQPNEETTDNAEYEFELFLSTDGKHTVHVKANRKNKNRAMKVATETYDYLLTRYGTKQGQVVREYGNGHTAEANQETCRHTEMKFAQSKTEKNPGRWFKSCKACGKFLGWQQ